MTLSTRSSASARSYTFRFLSFLLILQQYLLLLGNVLTVAQVAPARYPNPYQQQYVQNYQNEYQQQVEQPHRNTRYGHSNNNNNNNNLSNNINNNNNNMYHHNNNNKQPASRVQNYQQQSSPMSHHPNTHPIGQLRSNETISDRIKNKCRMWVPTDAIEKYRWASKIQVDQSNQLQLIEVCCPGYGPVRWRGNTLCRPLCENCQNGHCLSPGHCQCYEEFVKNDNGDCVFTCPLGCLNGRCYLDGSCQCDPGYKLDETRKFCRPICSNGCGQNARHNCTEPEVCGCAKGYQLTDDGCQPTCTPDCGVGGYCRDYNMCECGAGYTWKRGACQSDCYQSCNNGICYGRNRCICNPGFTYHEKSTHCIPT